MVVSDGRIVAVGPGLDGDEVVDCTGATVLPGLVDCHVHLLFAGVHPLKTLQTPFAYPYYEAVRNLRATLDAGSPPCGTPAAPTSGVKDAVADGLVPGPRVQIAVSMLSQTGGHGDGWYPSGCTVPLVQPHPGRPRTVVDGPEEVRARGPRAGPRGRRRDQGGDQRRRAVRAGRPAARALPRRGGRHDGRRGGGGRASR